MPHRSRKLWTVLGVQSEPIRRSGRRSLRSPPLGGTVKKLVAGITVALAASLVAVALAFGASATTISVGAKLNAKQEVPAQVVKDTKAKGLITGKLVGRKQ